MALETGQRFTSSLMPSMTNIATNPINENAVSRPPGPAIRSPNPLVWNTVTPIIPEIVIIYSTLALDPCHRVHEKLSIHTRICHLSRARLSSWAGASPISDAFALTPKTWSLLYSFWNWEWTTRKIWKRSRRAEIKWALSLPCAMTPQMLAHAAGHQAKPQIWLMGCESLRVLRSRTSSGQVPEVYISCSLSAFSCIEGGAG